MKRGKVKIKKQINKSNLWIIDLAVMRAFSDALGPTTGQTQVARKPSLNVAHTLSKI